jgi:hypothetical protein
MGFKKDDKKTEQLMKLWEQLSPEQKDVTLILIERIRDQPNENYVHGDERD